MKSITLIPMALTLITTSITSVAQPEKNITTVVPALETRSHYSDAQGNFTDVDDWYLVETEAMAHIESLRQEQLKLAKEAEKETWIDKRVIFQTELDILSAREKEGKVVVLCSQDDSQFNYCGGELIIDCKGIEVFDQRWNIVEYEKLKIINNKYWRELGSQK